MKPKTSVRIGVDIMGSDNAPQDLLAALRSFVLPKDLNLELHIVGLPEYAQGAHPFCFQVAHETIGMDESPLLALRRKKDASLLVGMRLLKGKKIDAFVSSGNTGALVLGARMVLSTFPSLLRPALLTLMPTQKKPVAVLDVGANVEAKARSLVQFAKLGAAYQKTRGIKNPRVGLLNIGTESLKGTSELRLAYKELQSLPLDFAGNIEGKSVFDGEVDVLVTDGFTGNIFLKTAEGIANLILDRLEAYIPPHDIPFFEELQKHLHYAEYPGALLAGVGGIVIKCHGYSTPRGFANGVLGAYGLASENFIEAIQREL